VLDLGKPIYTQLVGKKLDKWTSIDLKKVNRTLGNGDIAQICFVCGTITVSTDQKILYGY
jgi:hypothetical protein